MVNPGKPRMPFGGLIRQKPLAVKSKRHRRTGRAQEKATESQTITKALSQIRAAARIICNITKMAMVGEISRFGTISARALENPRRYLHHRLRTSPQAPDQCVFICRNCLATWKMMNSKRSLASLARSCSMSFIARVLTNVVGLNMRAKLRLKPPLVTWTSAGWMSGTCVFRHTCTQVATHDMFNDFG